MKSPHSLLIFLLLTPICVSFTDKKPITIYPYFGQRCPPDMEFIPGNDSIASFFISKSQETNMAYMLYIDWLNKVFVSYPEIVKYAEPHAKALTELHRFNDPAIQYSLHHPALTYYPVTGVDWIQANDYMQWKTDRMNEYILYSVYGTENYDNKYIVDENNFNTEAYLSNQYSVPGLKGADQYTHMGANIEGAEARRNLSETRPYFFTGLRLPTEEEFEYASRANFKNDWQSVSNNTPYGSPYYLSFFVAHIKDKTTPIEEYLKNMDPKESYELKRIKGGGAYNTSHYGVYNMGNNVKEWTMDLYTEQKKHYIRYEDIFWQNGFTNPDSIGQVHDQYGEMAEKDSMGRLRFRIMGVKSNGQDFRVNPYGSAYYYSYKSGLNPDSMIYINREVPAAVKWYMTSTHGYMFENVPQYRSFGIQYQLQVREEYKNRYKAIEDSMATVITRQLISARAYSFTSIVYIDSSLIRYRMVKSGTWKNPSVTAREKQREANVDSETGFRCVMQYNGFPIQEKYRVKW